MNPPWRDSSLLKRPEPYACCSARVNADVPGGRLVSDPRGAAVPRSASGRTGSASLIRRRTEADLDGMDTALPHPRPIADIRSGCRGLTLRANSPLRSSCVTRARSVAALEIIAKNQEIVLHFRREAASPAAPVM